MRILEIGCGPGVAARAIVEQTEDVYVLAIDRSEKAIQQAVKNSHREIASGRLEYRKAFVETFELKPGEERFDLAFAIRVGTLDGRHPETEQQALASIAKALTKNGRLFIDGGDPIRELPLDRYR
jgi:2-polyprenyl-3-methyl-5-hydroxy-6-metoxy-1,4-benzoquinol methylase